MGNSDGATHLRADTPAEVLAAARSRRRAADAAEVELLQLAVDWALLHPAESIEESETRRLRGFGETDLAIAGPGAPRVAEFSLAEFATTIEMGTEAGKCYVRQALELCYRLPRLWDRVVAGELPAWKARMVARETIRLTKEAAAFVDQHLASVAHKVKPAELDRLVNEAIGRFMPEEVERLAAQSWDKRHLTVFEQVARLERGNSLVGIEQVRAWCGAPATTQIVVQPVIDPDQCRESDSDQVPARIAEHVALRDHTCVFPWCTRPARRPHPDQPDGSPDHPCDCDHIHPRARDGPTCTCNLAPLCRRHHRLKTHSPWTHTVLDPGTYLWTSPHGYQLLRDPTGTIDVTPDRPRPPALDKLDQRRTP